VERLNGASPVLDRLEWLARDEHSSSLRTFVSYSRKKFYKIVPDDVSITRQKIEIVMRRILIATYDNKTNTRLRR
jgi:hypothetical protein